MPQRHMALATPLSTSLPKATATHKMCDGNDEMSDGVSELTKLLAFTFTIHITEYCLPLKGFQVHYSKDSRGYQLIAVSLNSTTFVIIPRRRRV